MEFLILLGICVASIAGVAWFGRRRQPDRRTPRYADMSSSMRQQRLAVEEERAKGRYAGEDYGGGL
jgi:hypothetical protein